MWFQRNSNRLSTRHNLATRAEFLKINVPNHGAIFLDPYSKEKLWRKGANNNPTMGTVLWLQTQR